MTPREQYELLKLVGALFDRTLEPETTSQFAQQLSADVAVRNLYADLVALNVDLEWSCNTHSQRDLFAAGAGIVVPGDVATETKRLSNSTGLEPAKSVPFRFRFGNQRYSVLSRPVLWCAAVVGLCLYGSFMMLAWNLRPDKRPYIPGNDGTVAIVHGASEIHWSHGITPKQNDSTIRAGESLKIESGTIELELAAGTKLVLEGPAAWTVDSRNSVSLRVGKLSALVPPQAVGFTIDTPTVQIIDLGTEFGVETNDNGTTEVQVFQGTTELRPLKSGKAVPLASPIKLSAGAARRIEPGDKNTNPTVREIAARPERFARQIATRRNRQIRVEAAMASSSQGAGRDVRFLHNGAGLTGECHGNQANFTMWNTELGKIGNEFVLFDLRYPHRLESMKVWNVNETIADYYRRVGAKHIDIYVSLSGKWDPLKRPDEWTKVQDHFRLTCATGKEDYHTPDVISLANVEARYVGIVFHDHLNEIQPSGGELQTVGLSEVQFFGERANDKTLDNQQKKGKLNRGE